VPVVIGESFRVSVNMEWSLMELCSLSAFIAALKQHGGASDRRGWLWLTGIFLGFTMCCKYPAWILPIAFIPALFIQSRDSIEVHQPPRLNIREFSYILAAAAAILSPWLIKNIWFYKNPIYPFFHEFLSPSSVYKPDWRQINAAGTNIQGLFTRPGLYSYLIFPLRFLNPPEGVTLSIGLIGLCFFLSFFCRDCRIMNV
jgi:4-amino-4-deoxy-L-arabinose transferase-like glycosyltransferase